MMKEQVARRGFEESDIVLSGLPLLRDDSSPP
jgi:hypothetical protein